MNANAQRVLIAGIGNVFLGDDGFGVAVAQELARRTLPPHVVVMDAGIRGLDLTYALMDGYDSAILIDATARGGAPGTLYLIDPQDGEVAAAEREPSLIDAHGMDPVRVLAFVRASGAKLRSLRVVGCEPESFGSDEAPQLGLSPAVARAVGPAIELVEQLTAVAPAARPAAEQDGARDA
jgi:hydrogenase maturation protease